MLDLIKAVVLATEAHSGQYRARTKVFPVNEHTLENWEISKLQQNNGTDFSICKEDGEYSMSIHLELFIAKPYITHPLEVMNMMTTEEEKIVAVLHDVFEDSKDLYINFDSIDSTIMYNDNEYFIPIDLAEALNRLTKAKGVSYTAYIEDICSWTLLTGNKLAAKVKLADIIHNLSGSPSEHAKQKYMKAIPLLLNSL